MASTDSHLSHAEGTLEAETLITDRDIVFDCPSCQGEMVVDREGVGLECLCAHCGFPLVIPEGSKPKLSQPPPVPPPATPPLIAPPTDASEHRHFDFSSLDNEQVTRRVEELKHQLKENMSQDVEMRGHVNRATIELHRLQLRLKKLQARQAEIEAEMIAAKAWLHSPSA